jgi:hypothetical protein
MILANPSDEQEQASGSIRCYEGHRACITRPNAIYKSDDDTRATQRPNAKQEQRLPNAIPEQQLYRAAIQEQRLNKSSDAQTLYKCNDSQMLYKSNDSQTLYKNNGYTRATVRACITRYTEQTQNKSNSCAPCTWARETSHRGESVNFSELDLECVGFNLLLQNNAGSGSNALHSCSCLFITQGKCVCMCVCVCECVCACVCC